MPQFTVMTKPSRASGRRTGTMVAAFAMSIATLACSTGSALAADESDTRAADAGDAPATIVLKQADTRQAGDEQETGGETNALTCNFASAQKEPMTAANACLVDGDFALPASDGDSEADADANVSNLSAPLGVVCVYDTDWPWNGPPLYLCDTIYRVHNCRQFIWGDWICDLNTPNFGRMSTSDLESERPDPALTSGQS